MIYQTKNPILIVVFNRPEIVGKTFEAIKKSKPKKIYVFADGPRKSVDTDKFNCKKTREIFNEKVDWDCEIITNYNENNLGCQLAVSSALKWFFLNEKQGIIFDDDCVASLSFFRFCDELLEKFKNDEKILLISGNNYFKKKNEYSYFASKNPCFYGWATWKRSWKNYDPKMRDWPKLKEKKWINDIFKDKSSRYYWTKVFDETYSGKKNTWDYQWWYLSLKNNSITLRPSRNLVQHIGSGKDSTHIKSKHFRDYFEPLEIDFPLKHPEELKVFDIHDAYENSEVWKIKKTYIMSKLNFIIKIFKKLIPLKNKSNFS